MLNLFKLLLVILSGLTGRIRGGLGNSFVGKLLNKHKTWEIPNGYVRFIWAAYITFIIYFAGYSNYYHIPIVLGLTFLGVVLGYFNAEFNLALDSNKNWRNYTRLTIRGAFIMLPVAVFLNYYGFNLTWLGVLAGAFFVPCYLSGFFLGKYLPFQGGSQWGEWLLYSLITLFML